MENLEFIINLIRKNYYKTTGLLLGILLILVFCLSFNIKFSNLISSLEFRFAICISLIVFWIFIWRYTTKYFPRVQSGKVGIIVAINAENEKQKTRIKVDFTKRLMQDLNRQKLMKLFQILVFNDHQSLLATKILKEYTDKNNELKNTNQEIIKIPAEFKNWRKFNKKVKGHFFLWGSIIERIEKENQYLLDVSGLVVHRPLKLVQSDKLRKHFLAVFPKEISFYEKFEISGFKFTADTIYIAVRYITGMAALYSGDPFIALQLHNGLMQEIIGYIQPLPPNLRNVKENLVNILSLENLLISKYYYAQLQDVKQALKYINQCLSKSPHYYDALILKSYILFKDHGNPIQSLKLLNLAGRYSRNNLTWLYNKAFLFMYLEKFEKGFKIYKRIENSSFPDEDNIVEQVLSFNENLLQEDHERIQCHFILGFIYWKKKQNLPMAFDHFENFINKSRNIPTYKFLYDKAEAYLNELSDQMRLNT